MAKFKSKPHTIEAFQFNGDMKFKPPKWFMDAYRTNGVQVTISEKYGNYITVYGQDQVEVAREGYWVCIADHGKIYVLDDKSFRASYKAIEPKRCKDTMDIEEII